MEIGSIVKFRDGLYADETKRIYFVIEDNGDRVFIKAINNLRLPPVSVAKKSELELVKGTDARKEDR